MWRVDFSHGAHKIEFIMEFPSRWSRLSLFDITAINAYSYWKSDNLNGLTLQYSIVGSAAHRWRLFLPSKQKKKNMAGRAGEAARFEQFPLHFNNMIQTGQWGWQNNACSSTSQLKCQQLNHHHAYTQRERVRERQRYVSSCSTHRNQIG